MYNILDGWYTACELIETIKIECSGSGGGTPDEMAAAQSSLPVPNPSRKHVSQFLAECVETKKIKVDLEGGLVKKRKELTKLRKQVSHLQKKIHVLTQELSAKELELEALTQEIETLTKEYTEAVK